MRDKEKVKENNKRYREKHKEKIKNLMREYYLKNKKRLNIQNRKNYQKNRQKIKEYRDTKEFKIKKNKYQRERRINDNNYAIGERLRGLLGQALDYYKKHGKILKCKKYPIDFEKIINYLSPIPDRRIYEIDHIKPLCSFDLSDPKQVEIAFAPQNLQFLLKYDNKVKCGSGYYKSKTL